MSNFGPQYLTEKSTNSNPFWQHVFEGWISMSKNITIYNNTDLLTMPLWFNQHISNNQLYLPDWYQKGIITVADVVSDNQVLSYNSLCQKFASQFNYLNYLTVKSKIEILLTKFSHTDKEFLIYRPIIPFYLKPILKDKKGVGTIYKILLNNPVNEHAMKSRWNDDFKIQIDHGTWKRIFSICFRTVANNSLIWFQLKLIYRILGTKKYLHKLGLKDTPNCPCCQQPETLLHIFHSCPNSINIWNDINKLVKQQISININFSSLTIIFGYTNKDQNHIPINCLIHKFFISNNYIWIYK